MEKITLKLSRDEAILLCKTVLQVAENKPAGIVEVNTTTCNVTAVRKVWLNVEGIECWSSHDEERLTVDEVIIIIQEVGND